MASTTIKTLTRSKNERKTENLVRAALTAFGYYDEEGSVAVEEQISSAESIRKLLKAASKSGKGGQGAPEFIISDHLTPDILVVFECKADTRDHCSSAVGEILKGKYPKETDDDSSRRNQRYAADGGRFQA